MAITGYGVPEAVSAVGAAEQDPAPALRVTVHSVVRPVVMVTVPDGVPAAPAGGETVTDRTAEFSDP